MGCVSRYVFTKGDQNKFLEKVKYKLASSWSDIASEVGVSGRTLRDWKREVLLGNKDVLLELSKLSGVLLPIIIEEKEEWWNTKAWSTKASKIRMRIYGPPGTPEGRSKGGKMSQLRRAANPEIYKDSLILFKNRFNYPAESPELAEFVGIMLGDGGTTKDQIKITLDINVDKEYAFTVRKMAKNLFGKDPSVYIRKEYNALTICLTGVDIVNYLVNKGLCIGSKIKANIGIPEWIKINPAYSRRCIRGLVDTDGCLFMHKHRFKEKIEYKYRNICFVSVIPRLMSDVRNQLSILGFTPKGKGAQLFLYNQNEARRYLA